MKCLAIPLVLLMLTGVVHAQTVLEGQVKDRSGKSIPFVNIRVTGTGQGEAADEEGRFRLTGVPSGRTIIKVSAVGYKSLKDTLDLQEGGTEQWSPVLVPALAEMEEVVVTGTRKEQHLRDSPVKVEVVSAEKLSANPESNIISSMGQVNGVRQQVNCGVCGTNNLRINGMKGPYTLVLIDGMPIMSSLASVYGFNGIPNSVVDRIEVIKGPSSTLYGTRAVGGVINVITKEPSHTPLAHVNSYYTTHGQSNTDVALSPDIGSKVHTMVSANYYRNQQRIDENGDNFTDIPLTERISLFNKWQIDRPGGRKATFAARYYSEDRFGGVMGWDEGDRGSSQIYGESIKTERWEFIGAYGLPYFEHVTTHFSLSDHYQDSYYGDSHYVGDQSVLYGDLTWDRNFGTHDLLAGLTARYRSYSDNTQAQSGEKRFVPGVFLQDEWSITEKTDLLLGGRADHHEAHGLILSPRLNLKQDLGRYTSLRLNGGTGFREVDLFTEDHAALSGTREVVVEEELAPERSWNVSLNLHHIYTLGEGTGTFDLDGFYTYFTNKIIPDYNQDPNLIVYENLKGSGVSRGVAFSVDHRFTFPLSIGLGGTFQDVYQQEKGSKKEPEIFSPVFSGVFNAAYTVPGIGVKLDYTGNVTGPQALPEYPEPFARPTESPWYSLHNLKLSRTVAQHLDLYVSVKNIFDYTQPSPLIDPEHPFSEDFDTEYAYGPLQGRRYLFGLSWKLHREGHHH